MACITWQGTTALAACHDRAARSCRAVVTAIKWAFPAHDYRWLVEETEEYLPKELDFAHEARNMERCRAHMQSRRCVAWVPPWSRQAAPQRARGRVCGAAPRCPSGACLTQLRDATVPRNPHVCHGSGTGAEQCVPQCRSRYGARVHVPQVHHELSSDRVLTMEFVRGCPVADPAALRQHGIKPQAVARLIAQVQASAALVISWRRALRCPCSMLFPDALSAEHRGCAGVPGQQQGGSWRFCYGVVWHASTLTVAAPRGSVADAAMCAVQVFTEMIFVFGDVHCDPHAANMLVQRGRWGRPRLVLLDHGLYRCACDHAA